MDYDALKKEMVKIIRGSGLPVAYSRCEADSSYEIYIDVNGQVTGIDYADGVNGMLEDLCLVDLAFLVERPIRGKELDREVEQWRRCGCLK